MQNLKFVPNRMTLVRDASSKEYFGYKNNVIAFANKIHAIKVQHFIQKNHIDFFYTKNNLRHYKLQKIAAADTRTNFLVLEEFTKDDIIEEVLNRNLVLRVINNLYVTDESAIILESDLSVNPQVNTKEYAKILSDSYNK